LYVCMNSVKPWKAYSKSSNTLKKDRKAPILDCTKAAKIVTTRRVFRAKIYENAFAATGGAYSAPPNHLAGFGEEEGRAVRREG